ncbi:MAG: DUF6488 family protein [bacterium]|nr:DUF6488 family protein [bacterium]
MQTRRNLVQLLMIGLFAFLLIPAAFAHGGHGQPDPLSKAELGELAKEYLNRLVDEGYPVVGKALGAEWKNVDSSKVEVQVLKFGFYQVQAQHPKGGEKIYLLINPNGQLSDINFKGDFGALK